MNRLMQSICTCMANVLWLASCLPAVVRFWFWTFFPRRRQRALLKEILAEARATAYGTHLCGTTAGALEQLRKLPVTEYEDYKNHIDTIMQGECGVLTPDPVVLLEPTSGSSSPSKLIPYTRSLQRRFGNAVDAWIGRLFLAFPGVLLGRHFWSISPNTGVSGEADSAVPIGFETDAEYLGPLQRALFHYVMAVPGQLVRVSDPDSFTYLLLLFLVRCRNLRLVSVWHYSFLLALVSQLPAYWESIVSDIRVGGMRDGLQVPDDLRLCLLKWLPPDPGRAEELSALKLVQPWNCRTIWPRLSLISCWDEAGKADGLNVLMRHFPGVTVQGKGLVATEGIVSIPFAGASGMVCAVNSHVFEFEDAETGQIHPLWEAQAGRTYGVVLTNGGGLYRYRLHDLVRVTGQYHATPCLSFVGRGDVVSDVVGEKLHVRHVEQVLNEAFCRCDCQPDFCMLAPTGSDLAARYVVYLQLPDSDRMDLAALATRIEHGLAENFHYRHARGRMQLESLQICRVRGNPHRAYLDHLAARGRRLGDIKMERLCRIRGWESVFEGELAATSAYRPEHGSGASRRAELPAGADLLGELPPCDRTNSASVTE